MCGIAGSLARAARLDADELERRATAMSDRLAHRGPDDAGVWSDAAAGIALSQRRLAVVDLSVHGRQPMVSASGRTVLVYNGELYDTGALRRELEAAGVRFRGSSDTEVLVEAIDRFGVARAVERCVGMFAFAAWDRERRTLSLVRDRLGVKPLIVAAGDDGVLFASELSALLAHPALDARIDRGAIAALLRRGTFPGTMTALEGVRQVEPGTIVTVRATDDGRLETSTSRYWDLVAIAEAAAPARADTARRDEDVLDEVAALVDEAVRIRMLADVPLGAFLSGGIDSTLVVAAMQAASASPIRTFTIGSDVTAVDESGAARAVAAHLGTDHTELVVTDAEAAARAPGILAALDQPHGDSSIVPTTLVSELARAHVTVALSGDGGDEGFAGYTRHVAAARLARLAAVPVPLRRAAAATLSALPAGAFGLAARALPASRRPQLPADRAAKLALALGARDVDDLHHRLTSAWSAPERVVLDAEGRPGRVVEPPSWSRARDLARWPRDPVERMLLTDTLGYLPDDVLMKVDRASMSCSLEARVPLLDHRLIEAAWRLPLRFRLRGGTTKWALRELVARRVPRALTERAKAGFALPVDRWLRGPLREWGEDLLSPAALADGGLLDAGAVRRVWDDHRRGRGDRQHALWVALSVAAWQRRTGLRA